MYATLYKIRLLFDFLSSVGDPKGITRWRNIWRVKMINNRVE